MKGIKKKRLRKRVNWKSTEFLFFLKNCRMRVLLNKPIFLILFFVLLASFNFPGCKADPSPYDISIIRVAVSEGKKLVELYCSDPITVRSIPSGKGIYRGKLEKPFVVGSDERTIRIGNGLYRLGDIRISTRSDKGIIVNKKKYRGEVEVLRKGGKLLVINVLDIESYLRGVVPSEMLPSWDQDALKAQAVCSRSFALYNIIRNRENDYHISSTTQVYNGMEKEDPRTDKAIRATRGEVLYYKGKLLLSYFHTCCGGHTEYAGNVWEAGFRFPRPVRCSFCKNSPYYEWEVEISAKSLEKKLSKDGVKGMKTIRPYRKSRFGDRITQLVIRCKDGKKKMKINRFRLLVGPDVVKSGLFTVREKKEDVFEFKGRGWGHGVGLCQWGAKDMADVGYSYESILKYYFPGSRLKKVKW